MAGFLSEYANPNLIRQEKRAWQEAVLDKHIKSWINKSIK